MIPGETPKMLLRRKLEPFQPGALCPQVPDSQKAGDFPMSLSGNWLILVNFQDQHADDGLGCLRWPQLPSLFPKNDVPDLEDSPDWKDGLLQDPGV